MKKLKEFFKSIDNITKICMVLLLVVFILLCINISVSVTQINEYNLNKNNGNERWHQVEDRILQYERRIDELEKYILDNK